MSLHDPVSFKKLFASTPPLLSLIVGKGEEDRRILVNELVKCLKQEGASLLAFEGALFCSERFVQEVETRPLLSNKVIVEIFELEKLTSEQLARVLKYAVHPNEWVHLVLSSSAAFKSLKAYKELAKTADVLVLQEEKPWEKEKKLADWLVRQAALAECVLEPRAAHALTQNLGNKPTMLLSELEKLICFIGNRTQITYDDVRAICFKMPQETLWQLGDAIFSLDSAKSVAIAHSIIEEGMSFFPLVAHLRTQFRNALLTLSYFRVGGASEVSRAFPYLKGGLLDKKLSLFQNYGENRLKKGLILLFDHELLAKSGAQDPIYLLEILLVRVTSRYAYFTT